MPLVTSKVHLEDLISKARASGFMAFDSETTGIEWFKHSAFGASFCFDGENGYYITRTDFDELLPVMAKALGDPNVAKAAHNAKFDMHHLRQSGITIRGKVYDTEIMARLVDETQPNYKLKDICARLWGAGEKEAQDGLKTWMKENGVERFDAVPLDIMVPYACQDAVLVWKLFKHLMEQIKAKDAACPEGIQKLEELLDRECNVLRIVEQMEKTGHLIDMKFLEDYQVTLAKQQEEARLKVVALAGEEFNLNSDEQVSAQMMKLGWVPKEQTKTGAAKTDKWAMEDWDHPFSESMLEYRRCGKLISTYCKGMLERALPGADNRGVIHTDYRTNGAATGRFSCTNPNLQNTDKKSEARQAFLVRPGYVNVYLDFKQIEICGFAYYAGDKIMQDALWEGEDFHMMNAEVIFAKRREEITPQERDKAKTFNFALLYGAGIKRIAKMLKITEAESGTAKKRYFDKFTSVQRLSFKCQDAIRKRGFVINRFGRYCHLAPEDGYKAMNRLIQSWAADLLKEAMCRADKVAGKDFLLQIHDELVVQVPIGPGMGETISQLKSAMESVGDLVPTVPIRVDMKVAYSNWHEREELKDADLPTMHSRDIQPHPARVSEVPGPAAGGSDGGAK